MRAAALLLVLFEQTTTLAIAEEAITIHPFELTTRGKDLDGRLVATHCTLLAFTQNGGVCLAPNGFGEIDNGAEIDLSFTSLPNLMGAFNADLDHASRECGGNQIDKACRVTIQGHARYGRAFPAIDVTSIRFQAVN